MTPILFVFFLIKWNKKLVKNVRFLIKNILLLLCVCGKILSINNTTPTARNYIFFFSFFSSFEKHRVCLYFDFYAVAATATNFFLCELQIYIKM
jgi:hypothetical protein